MWTVKTLYSNNRFELLANERGWTVVRPFTTGVCVLGMSPDGQYLLVKEPRIDEWGRTSLHLNCVKGMIDANESPRDAAMRELKEETGIQVQQADLQFLGLCRPDNGFITSSVSLFRAHLPLDFPQSFKHKTESQVHPLVFTLVKLKNLVANGRLNDSVTHSAFLLSSLSPVPVSQTEHHVQLRTTELPAQIEIQRAILKEYRQLLSPWHVACSLSQNQVVAQGWCYAQGSQSYEIQSLYDQTYAIAQRFGHQLAEFVLTAH